MNRRLIQAAVYTAFVVVLALTIARIIRALDNPYADTTWNNGLTDFHNAVYFPAVAYWDGVSPYSQQYADEYPVNHQLPPYSPACMVLHLPFAMLPMRVADVAYFVFSLALVFALAISVLVVCRIQVTHLHVVGLVTLVLLSRPGHLNIVLGQLTLPVALGAIWALELARRRPSLAGLALAVTTLKPTFGIPMVWLMFCRRDFRAVLVGVAIGGGGALLAATPLILGDGLSAFVDSLRQGQELHEADPMVTPAMNWTRVDLASVLGRFSETADNGAVELSVAVLCLLGAGWAVFHTSNKETGNGADSLSAVVITTATLAAIYHQHYDPLLLLLPWVGLSFGRTRCQVPKWALPVLWLAVTLPAVNYLSTRTAIEFLGLEGIAWTAAASFNGIAILIALLLSAGIATFDRHRSPAALPPAPQPGSIAA